MKLLHSGNRTRTLIHRAIEHYANYTCIKFRPKTDKDVDYIYYTYQPGSVDVIINDDSVININAIIIYDIVNDVISSSQ